MLTKEVEVHGNVDENIISLCGTCKSSNRARVLSRVTFKGRELDGDSLLFGWDDIYEIIQCQGCQNLAFRRTHTNSEDTISIQTPDGYDEIYNTIETIYPNPIDRELIADNHLLPLELKNIYQETIRALNLELFILGGIGVRAILETVCNDRQAEGRNLLDKINRLVQMGYLTKDGASILHHVRALGNAAAHEARPQSKESLCLAMDVIEHLMIGLYILPVRANYNLL